MAIAPNPTDALAGTAAEGPRLALLGLGVATVGWASAFIVGKLVLAEMTPLAVATWRYAFATALLAPFAWPGRRAATETAGAPWRTPWRAIAPVAAPLAVMVVAGGLLYPWLFLGALHRTSAANTSLLIALNPVMTLFLTPLVGERIERRRLLGAAIAFSGAVVVITGGDLARLAGLELNTGDLLAILAAACWASFNLASRPVLARLSPAVANIAVYAGGFAALFALAEDPLGQIERAAPWTVAGIAAMAVLSSVLAGQLFLIGVREVGVGRSVVFVYLVPVLTAALSVPLLGEPFTFAQLAGGCGVLAGLWIASSPAR